jgi:CRISPR-associated protein Csy2
MSNEVKKLILLPHVKVHNANALSSPFSIGVPAMTAWLGAVHALQRKLNQDDFADLSFNATGVISHECDLQTHKGVGDYVSSIIGTGNPLDKTGSRSAFIEEARCHLDVSLLIEFTGINKNEEERVLDRISHHLYSRMKMAGGDIKGFDSPTTYRVEEGNSIDLAKITRQLMPGYAIVERRDLMVEAMEAGQDAMDALIDNLAVHHSCEKNDDEVIWSSYRQSKGWIVPIATGFHGITKLGQAKNQRNEEAPHRFAESIVTLGEFKMPHRVTSIDELLWRYSVNNDLYLCEQIKDQPSDEWAEFY